MTFYKIRILVGHLFSFLCVFVEIMINVSRGSKNFTWQKIDKNQKNSLVKNLQLWFLSIFCQMKFFDPAVHSVTQYVVWPSRLNIYQVCSLIKWFIWDHGLMYAVCRVAKSIKYLSNMFFHLLSWLIFFTTVSKNNFS